MIARVIFFCFLCQYISHCWSFQCLNEGGTMVDWYATYKVPRISKTMNQGLTNYYLDVNAPNWRLSKYLINGTGTAVYNTLSQVYSTQDEDVFYVMYNDERPGGGTSGGGGHTKGVVAFNGKSGFWLIHSVPKFPPMKDDGYAYPTTGETYGQSMLCISLPYEMLGVIGKQLLYNEPHIYDKNIPDSILRDFPVLGDVIKGKRPKGPPWYNVASINSIRGQKFTSFAKSTSFHKDLYIDLVAPILKDSLLVETWMDGGGQVATNCSVEYKVYNVIHVSLPGGVLFKRSKDHSKWATAFNAGQRAWGFSGGYWTCIGDINHMYTQFKRGGGTVCIDNQSLWKTFRNSVEKFEKCNKMS